MSENQDVGYFVVCDIHYPSELHESHSDLPLIPCMETVTFDDLSEYAKKSLLGAYPFAKHEKHNSSKLLCTFRGKKRLFDSLLER